MKVEPCPSVLSTVISPASATVIVRLMARPSPAVAVQTRELLSS